MIQKSATSQHREAQERPGAGNSLVQFLLGLKYYLLIELSRYVDAPELPLLEANVMAVI